MQKQYIIFRNIEFGSSVLSFLRILLIAQNKAAEVEQLYAIFRYTVHIGQKPLAVVGYRKELLGIGFNQTYAMLPDYLMQDILRHPVSRAVVPVRVAVRV
jgi:hypothetical protein